MHTHDIIVIGAGSGGLNIASFMNKAGFKVLLIDKSDSNIGGDCLNFGCVPSKALIHISRLIYDAKKSSNFGLRVGGVVNMKKVKDYIKAKKDVIREHENASYFRGRGMDVEFGTAKFNSSNSVVVNGKEFSSKKIVLATGARPRKLDIPNIDKVRLITNENIFDLEKLPKRLLVIGGGPIGIELGQAFARLGSKVSVVQRGSGFLPKEEPKISKVLFEQLKKEGMQFYFNSVPLKFSAKDEVVLDYNGAQKRLNFDYVLVSAGRVLNIEGLDLEKAGIELTDDKRKIKVNKYLQATNKNVYLCGDIAGGYQFTHAAELHAGVILNNFFSPFKKKLSYDNFSWVTYTYPEIATFGINEAEIKKRGIKYEKLETDFNHDDRAIVDDFTGGKMVLYISKNKLLGGCVITPNAGELFQELVLAKTANLDIKNIFNKIYPYPTASRINKRIISNYFSKRLTPFSKKYFRFVY